jgi:hypothetical protein
MVVAVSSGTSSDRLLARHLLQAGHRMVSPQQTDVIEVTDRHAAKHLLTHRARREWSPSGVIASAGWSTNMRRSRRAAAFLSPTAREQLARGVTDYLI